MTRPAGKKETMTTELVREDGSMHEAGRLVAGDRESPYIEILDASGLGAMKTERKTKGATK